MTGFGAMALLTVLPLALLGQELAVDDLVPLDRTVVAVVLDDLVAYRGKDSPIDEIFSPKPLTLDPAPDRYPRR